MKLEALKILDRVKENIQKASESYEELRVSMYATALKEGLANDSTQDDRDTAIAIIEARSEELEVERKKYRRSKSDYDFRGKIQENEQLLARLRCIS